MRVSKNKSSKQVDMINGSLTNKIMLFALPLAASSILQQLFNSADVAVVGRFAGSQALAAVGSNGSVIALIINLFAGLSIGANVVVAKFIGQGRKEKANEAVHTSILVALISGFFLIAVGIILAKPILTLMDTPDDVINLATLYLRIYFVGMPFVMVYNFGSSILRSKGDTKRPLICLVVSGIINIGLNLLLVIVFKLSVAGVAIATVVSNGVSSAMIIYYLMNEDDSIRLDLKKLSVKKEYLISIVRIGAPAGIQGMVFSLSNVCIQSAINSFGSNAVAGSAAAINFEYFTYFVINAFSQAAVTFTSQNYGAMKFDRCKRVFRITLLCSMVVCAIMSISFVVGSKYFIRIYTTDSSVIDFALIRMIHVLLFEFLPATYEISGGTLRGMGHSLVPAILTVIGSCGLRILWIYTVFKKFDTFEMLMNVYPVSWLITGAAVTLSYFVVRKKLFKSVNHSSHADV